jgi:hypothetical protein
MSRILVPCPHCSQPIALGWGDMGGGSERVSGRCRHCRGAYRFFDQGRRPALIFAAIYGAVLLAAGLRLQAPCAICDRLRAQPLFAFAPLVTIVLLSAILLFVLLAGMRVAVHAAVRDGRDYEVLEPVAEKDLPFSDETIRRNPVGAGFSWLLRVASLVVVVLTMLPMLRELLRAGHLVLSSNSTGPIVNETVDMIVYGLFVLALVLSVAGAVAVGVAGTVRYLRVLRRRQ